MAGHIVVVGSLNMDLVVRTPRHPSVGETIVGGKFGSFPGGKGANQAVAAARLGAVVKMIGRVGTDGFSDVLLQTLAKDGVDTTHIMHDREAATGVALITVDASGRNTIVVALGANGRVAPADVSAAESLFEDAKVLLLQLECPLDAVARAVELARKHDVPVVLNPAPAPKIDPGLLAQVDYLIPNQSELYQLSGLDSIDAGVQRLQGMGVQRIMVTLGEDGVLVAEGSVQTRLPAHHVPVVDTTAAGDAFVAAFAVAVTEGRSTREAAAWANAAGALAVTKMGAQPSLPTRAELVRFLDRHSQGA